jgi:aryl-alcohol dehydrogenase-like predicted oxidoreductase
LLVVFSRQFHSK